MAEDAQAVRTRQALGWLSGESRPRLDATSPYSGRGVTNLLAWGQWTAGRWRRKRDSNPRASYPANGFQDRRFQPLTHSSAFRLANSAPLGKVQRHWPISNP